MVAAQTPPPIAMPVAVLVEETTDALARLDTEMGDRLAPFSSLLLRTEAASSSQIEGLTASARAIAEAEIGIRATGNATEIVANAAAMRIALSTPILDESAILTMNSALLSLVDPPNAGRWRTEQVWIGGIDFLQRLKSLDSLFCARGAVGGLRCRITGLYTRNLTAAR